MEKQIKSKKRVADHGEVFTAEREVYAMLDLVKQETERVDRKVLQSITKPLAMALSVGSTRLESTFVFNSPLVRRCSPWKPHLCKASSL